VKAIVADLRDRITSLNENLTTEEADYAFSVTNTRSGLNEAGSFDLELYDLTENSATGMGGSGVLTASTTILTAKGSTGTPTGPR
jgi:hypothetical protein